LSELIIQKKPLEMINLISDNYKQTNYYDGKIEHPVIKGKKEALEYLNDLVKDDIIAIQYSIHSLKLNSIKAVASGQYLISHEKNLTIKLPFKK
jgi:hypothetical protein